jgi:flavin-dependent dehydrogenase
VGLFAALLGATSGFAVRVVEPLEPPIDKACGEGLMPGGLAALRSVGVDPPGRDFTGIRYVTADGGASAEARFSAGPGRGVRRTALHAALHSAAVDGGVEIVPDRVVGVDDNGDGVTVRLGSGDSVGGAFLLAADGLHSTVRGLVGVAARSPGRPRFGLRQHFDARPWSDLVEVYWSSASEAYVTPVGDGAVGVAFLGARRGQSVAEQLAQFPALSERLDGSAPVDRPRGAGPLRQTVARRVQGRTLLIGDAAGYVDALTGEGLSVGFASAKAATASVLAGRPADYETAWRHASRRYRWLTRSMLEVATRQPTRRVVVPIASAWPRLFRAAVDSLA